MRPAATRRRLVLAVLCAAPFVLVLDTTIVTVALPSIGRDLGFSTATLHWVLASYALIFGGLLLLGGRLADLFGRRRLFLAGAGLFAAASALGGLAVAPWMLLAARVLQGVGAAALMPAALALVTSTFQVGPERDRALGVYSGVAALGGAAGVVAGGVLTQLLGWRWVLFAAVPIALTAFLLPASLPAGQDDPGPHQPLDLPGAVTITAALAALLEALTVQAAGLLVMALALPGRGLAAVLAGTVVWATGKVVADVAGTITATAGLGEDRKGLAAGLLSTAQQLGAACGLGVVAAVVSARTDALGLVEGLQWGLMTGFAFATAALAVVLVGLSRPERPGPAGAGGR